MLFVIKQNDGLYLVFFFHFPKYPENAVHFDPFNRDGNLLLYSRDPTEEFIAPKGHSTL